MREADTSPEADRAPWVFGSVTRTRHGSLPAGAVAAIAGYGALATTLDPFTLPMRVATAVPCAVLVGLAVVRGWHRRRPPATSPSGGAWFTAGMAAWFVLIALAAGVQLANFFASPRDVYPTLSSLAGHAFAAYPIRGLAFTLWLWLGWYLLDR